MVSSDAESVQHLFLYKITLSSTKYFDKYILGHS